MDNVLRANAQDGDAKRAASSPNNDKKRPHEDGPGDQTQSAVKKSKRSEMRWPYKRLKTMVNGQATNYCLQFELKQSEIEFARPSPVMEDETYLSDSDNDNDGESSQVTASPASAEQKKKNRRPPFNRFVLDGRDSPYNLEEQRAEAHSIVYNNAVLAFSSKTLRDQLIETINCHYDAASREPAESAHPREKAFFLKAGITRGDLVSDVRTCAHNCVVLEPYRDPKYQIRVKILPDIGFDDETGVSMPSCVTANMALLAMEQVLRQKADSKVRQFFAAPLKADCKREDTMDDYKHAMDLNNEEVLIGDLISRDSLDQTRFVVMNNFATQLFPALYLTLDRYDLDESDEQGDSGSDDGWKI